MTPTAIDRPMPMCWCADCRWSPDAAGPGPRRHAGRLPRAARRPRHLAWRAGAARFPGHRQPLPAGGAAHRADRLRGVAVVDASIDDAALRGLDDDGVRGIRLNLIGRPAPDLEGADWRRLFARVRALDWHVEVHAESQRLGAIAAPVLAAGCALVVDHFGRPSVVPPSQDPGFAWLLGAATHDRVWVKLSAAYRNAAPTQADAVAVDAAQALCAAFGAERLVWGSDWPHTQHRDVADFASAHAALVAWVPDADARRRILVDTPARL